MKKIKLKRKGKMGNLSDVHCGGFLNVFFKCKVLVHIVSLGSWL